MPETSREQQRVLLSGAGGFLGRPIAVALRAAGAEVVPLVRRRDVPGAVFWDPLLGELDPETVSGFDAVVHLAGEPVLGRWTTAKKQKIYQSRVQGTETLALALRRAPRPPAAFLCASGINIYGDCGAFLVQESRPPGKGFLPEVCVGWERAVNLLEPACRVVAMRIGVVLGREGGALPPLLPLFRAGLGGVVAGGGEYLSWIALEDLVRVVQHLLGSRLRGAVNVVAPEPATGREFADALAAAVHRRALISIPAFVLRAALGQFGEETALSSVRAVPERLLEDGFHFEYGRLQEALVALTSR